MTPEKRVSHALQKIKIAERMIREAREVLCVALKPKPKVKP